MSIESKAWRHWSSLSWLHKELDYFIGQGLGVIGRNQLDEIAGDLFHSMSTCGYDATPWWPLLLRSIQTLPHRRDDNDIGGEQIRGQFLSSNSARTRT